MHGNGHFSTGKTKTLVKRDYWFENQKTKVDKVVRNYVMCIPAEKKSGKRDGVLHPIEKGEIPLEVYHIKRVVIYDENDQHC